MSNSASTKTIKGPPGATGATGTVNWPGATSQLVNAAGNAINVGPGLSINSGALTTNINAILYWNSIIDGNPSNTSLYPGTLSGNAAMASDVPRDGVRLTPASNGQQGTVYWNVTDFDFSKNFQLDISAYMGAEQGSSSADGIFVNLGHSSSGSTNPANALQFWFHTYTYRYTTLSVNSVAVSTVGFHAQQTNGIVGAPYFGAWSNMTLKTISRGSTRYACLYMNGILENICSLSAWTPSGKYVEVGALTGGANATHNVNNVMLYYI